MEPLVSFTVSRTGETLQPLLAWAHGPWPDYYEDAMMIGWDSAFRYFNREPICDGFAGPA